MLRVKPNVMASRTNGISIARQRWASADEAGVNPTYVTIQPTRNPMDSPPRIKASRCQW
jgi:hypothetical protein